MTIFTLAHTDYEEYSPHHFVAPDGATEEQFTELCNNLIDPAVDELIKRGGWSPIVPDEQLADRDITWIGWREIVEIIAQKLLPEHGYQPVKFHEVSMWGGGIIGGSFNPISYEDAYNPENAPNEHLMPKATYEKIVAHNQAVQKRLEEDRRKKLEQPTHSAIIKPE